MSKDGGPAFPTADELDDGMSLRDWFAGMALPGLFIEGDHREGKFRCDVIARSAYQMADAMLKAREQNA